MALGNTNSATAASASAKGISTLANYFGMVSIGRFNALTASPNATSWVATDSLFVAGNGSSFFNRSNALILLKNGNMTIAGTLTENSDIRLKTTIIPL